MNADSKPSVRADHADAAQMTAAKWRLCAGAILAMAALLFFARLGSRALWSSEFRWAEISREMLVTHNYFWPTINGRVYYDKPLGSYWLVVASTWLTGAMNETAARIPSALAGLLGVAFMMILARRLYNYRTALLAGVIVATSFSYVFFARHAAADVETVSGELAALALFMRYERRQDGWWVLGLWLVMAITSQTKGLLGFVLPIMVIGLYCSLADGWRELGRGLLSGSIGSRVRWVAERNRWLFNWKSVIAVSIGLGLYFLPFEFSSEAVGSDKGLQMVWRENVVRFFHPFDHRGPIYIYLYVIFAIFAPWAMLLPAALVEAHTRRNLDEEPARSDRFSLVYFWGTFIFFTLSGSRRSYYILPIVPAGALLVARLLMGGALRSQWARRLLTFGYGLLAVGVIGGIVIMMPPRMILPGHLAQMPHAPDRVWFAIAWVLCVGGILYALRKYRPERIAVSVGIIAYCVMAYIYVFAMPAADIYRGEKPFALETLRLLGGDTSKLALYKTVGPLFYLNPPKPIPEYEKVADLTKAIDDGSVRWVIVRRRDIPNLAIPTEIEAAEASWVWETKYNYRNKVVLIRINPKSGA